MAISSSMILVKAGRGCAPTSLRPLMKKVGVPRAPRRAASCSSSLISSEYLWSSIAASTLLLSRPCAAAILSSVGRERSRWFLKRSSWTAQNLSFPPCLNASIATWAAGSAFGWKGSGLLRHTSRTLSPYCLRICSTVGSTRPQNGHWKSLNSTMVTSASGLPRSGCASVMGTLYRSTSLSAGAAALSAPFLAVSVLTAICGASVVGDLLLWQPWPANRPMPMAETAVTSTVTRLELLLIENTSKQPRGGRGMGPRGRGRYRQRLALER